MSVVKKPSRTAYLASLRTKVQEMSSPKSTTQKQDDERYWKVERDVTGKGSAIIRFLPAKIGEEFPFVQMHTHGFQGPTSKWFIDNCPTSIGETCPVCKANTALWNSGVEADKKIASDRKRKLIYISNILVVNDPKHPELNGQVKLYKYGKRIFDKIKDMIDPSSEFAEMEEVIEPIDPFDPEEGANFKLRVIKKDNFPNYDNSSFDRLPNGNAIKSAIGDEDFIATTLNQLNSLNELVEPAHFKSYSDLKKRFDMVTGETSADDADDTISSKPALVDSDEEAVAPVVPKATPKAAPKTTKTATAAPATDSSDDFFANLAKQTSAEKA